jgi:histidinol phosphate phosphatase hisN-like protein
VPTLVPTREQLRAHLVETLIAGPVATPRQNNLLHYRRMVARNPYYLFGLELRQWTEREVLAMMAAKCGVDPDPRHLYGDDTIDPELTISALEAMAERIGAAARSRASVVLATGHPQTLLPVYLEVAAALRAHGCRILTPAAGWSYEMETRNGPERRFIRYAEGVVAVVEDEYGRAHHTHDSAPMEAMLSELAGESQHWPDLAMADHGWAGAAGQAGIVTVGFADSNDPALFAGEVEGKIAAVVPLDDGVLPRHYAPLTGYLLSRAGVIV